ncbi:MAG: hypothetical protein MZU97_10710 [Bacillus subtilis]|nr:hypothetical protein [Bacillus subtilis]
MSALYKKIVMTGLVVLVAFVITIGSTYAWFTIGQTADVGNMDLTISSSESILILMDNNYNINDNGAFLNTPTNYKSILRTSDIQAVYNYTGGRVAFKTVDLNRWNGNH